MDDKLFDLMTKMYTEMQEIKADVKATNNKVDRLETKVDKLENKVDKLQIHIEQIIEPKIEALFDSYTQNTETLQEIKAEVAKHEEVIIRRVK